MENYIAIIWVMVFINYLLLVLRGMQIDHIKKEIRAMKENAPSQAEDE